MQTQLLGLQPGVSVAGQMASSQAGLARSTAILVPVGSAAGQKVFTTQARTDQVYFQKLRGGGGVLTHLRKPGV